MLLWDTEISKLIMSMNRNLLRTGERLTSWLFTQSVEELNLEPPNTNPSSGKQKDLNPGASNYKM